MEMYDLTDPLYGWNEGGNMEQVAVTVDAIDSWMVNTAGAFMKNEPFARLG
jgi:hypothetical protein